MIGTPIVGRARILAIESAESLALARQAELSSRVTIPASQIADNEGGLYLFKWGQNQIPHLGGWRTGDYMLWLPDQGSPKANWLQNSSRLRAEMGFGDPIFDSFVDPKTGLQIPARGFLNAERALLESHGWIYDPRIRAYLPPTFPR